MDYEYSFPCPQEPATGPCPAIPIVIIPLQDK
jgi:hypothetical protein